MVLKLGSSDINDGWVDRHIRHREAGVGQKRIYNVSKLEDDHFMSYSYYEVWESYETRAKVHGRHLRLHLAVWL